TDCEYAILAITDIEGNPYCVPISPVIEKGNIYFHSATEGKKIDYLKSNQNVCISAVSYSKLLPYSFSTEYKSAIAYGKATFIEDNEEKTHVLRSITEKYALANLENFDAEVTSSIKRTLVVKIQVDNITGKANISDES
ncbi:MAG: pyridoxamine 5'-phosphate oxidase family protein, partial [Oscillospiraceae bacterium]|nr:pyridoxamine 5'-phosphate oxidase family protein [Oscillospiraceae bacterium]